MKLILINAPPRAGKDTAAWALKHYYHGTVPVIIERMSFPLKRAFAGMLNTHCDPLGRVHPYENHKDEPIPMLSQLQPTSYRNWQIAFSEDFMKVFHGQNIFGLLLAERLLAHTNNELVIIPDCGFQIEVETILETIHPHDRIMLIQIERPGTKWDSREPVTAPPSIATLRILNDRTQEEFESLIIEMTRKWIETP